MVVLTDDLDETTLRDAETRGWLPNISALRMEGTTFASSFVALSLCCPSRATFLTGRYPHNTRVLSNVMPEGGVDAFDDASTIAVWLENAGYFTGHVGKYLNHYGNGGATGVGALRDTYVPPGWNDWQATVDPTTYRMYDYTINDNGTLVTYGAAPSDYQTDVLAQRATEMIAAAPASKPLFLVVAPLAVHLEAAEDDPDERGNVRPAPRHAWVLDQAIDIPRGPAFNEPDVTDKAHVIYWHPELTADEIAVLSAQYRGRSGSLLAVDDLVGRIRDELAARGRLDNTVIVFTSDNGWLYGEHRVSQKRYPYEPSIRVPLVIRDFRQLAAQRVVNGIAINIDLAPTFAALADVTPPTETDGRSLVPLLAGVTPPVWRRRFLVRGPAHSKVNFVGVRTGPEDVGAPNHIYIHYQERCFQRCDELYDLDVDPDQLDSKHRSSPPELLWLQRWVDVLSPCSGETCRRYEDCVHPDAC